DEEDEDLEQKGIFVKSLVKLVIVVHKFMAEEMAQIFRQRIAQAEAMAHADMLKFQPESGVTLNSDVMLGAMTEDLPTVSLDLDDIPNVP
ncbi:hypothetical protein Tco_1127346, partial [Tanacetum coccineum]